MIEIWALTDGDIPTVIALWERCQLIRPENDPRADISRARSTANAEIFVGKREDAVVATVMVGFDGHRGWVYYLAVEPTLQRAGYGKAMMNAAEHWLRARNVPKLLLMVSEENAAALGFYEALGFEESPVTTLGRPLN